MAQAPDPLFYHGKFLVDSTGLDATLRPKYDYILEEMAKADGINLFHADLRTGPDDKWLVVDPHCFDSAFQFKMKYLHTLTALMQNDGIPLSTQLRFPGKQCKLVRHKQFIDPDIERILSESGAVVPRAAGGAENSEDAWVDVAEELEKTAGVEHQALLRTRVASLDQDQKNTYMDLVRKICEKKRIPCNIGEAPVEKPQVGLLRAIWEEDLAQVLSLYQSLKDSDERPLHAALLESIKAQRLKLVDFFLDEGATFTQTRSEDYVIWLRASPELYEILLRRNWHDLQTNPAFLDECLMEACRASRADVVQYLMRKGAQPKKASRIPYVGTLALAVRSKEVLDYVLFKGEREPEIGGYDRDAVAMTIQGSGAMQVAAAERNDMDVVRTLLRWGADVNEVPRWDLVGDPRESDNGPALHTILCKMAWKFESQERHDQEMEKYCDMIAFLLENGANPNIENMSRLNAWQLLERVPHGNKARVAEIMKPYRPREVDGSADSTL